MSFTTNLFVLALIGYTASQYLTPPLVGISPIGTNYQTDDSSRQEIIDEDGNVQGQYSYVDPNGKTINVRYTAGKEGFKIIGQQAPTQQQENYNNLQTYYQPPQASYNQGYKPDLQGYQSQSVFQQQEYQPKFTNALFTPSNDPYPAATDGQFKSMKEYLEEEKMEIEKEKQMRRQPAQSHVSVNTPHQEYSYNINL